MKRIILITLVALLTASSAPLLHAAAGSVSYTATYDLTKLAVGTTTLEGVTYSTVSYRGLFNDGAPGAPSLPVQYLRFSVPYNATNFSVTFTSGGDITQQLAYPVSPCPSDISTLSDNAIYNAGNQYPQSRAWFVQDGWLAGENHIVTIAVMPIAYDGSQSNTLYFTEDACITLSYELTETLTYRPLVRDGAGLRNAGYELTQSRVVNPNQVQANAASSALNQPRLRSNDLTPDENVDNPDTYLIITSQEMMQPMRRLAALRNQKGQKVKLVSLQDALNDTLCGAGDSVYFDSHYTLTYDDDAGKMRQYLREHYLHRGTLYVLFAGDDMPVRDNSDVYFSGLDYDWDYRKDFDPELFVGRLLGSAASQIDNYADKLFMYELNPGNGDYSYLKRGLYTEGPGFETDLGGMQVDMAYICPYETHMMSDVNDDLVIKGCDLIDSISTNHYGFMATMNEGWPSCIKLYDKDNVQYYLWALDTVKSTPVVTDTETGNGLNRMDNRYFPMIYYSVFGRTMPFIDYNNTNVAINYGESFTTGKDYGGPVFIGYTTTIGQESARVLAGYFSSSLRTASQFMLNEALSDARSEFFDHTQSNSAVRVNYLGDPMVKIWSDTPQKYNNITVSRGNGGITVSGISTSGTTVSYCSNDGMVGSCTTSSSSVTLSNVSPNSAVMLYMHNHIPYIAPLVLQNTSLSNSQYVIASDVSAGRSVDSGRTSGKVTVSNGTEYEIEASGEVKLAGGFEVELGAYFSVTPSSYK